MPPKSTMKPKSNDKNKKDLSESEIETIGVTVTTHKVSSLQREAEDRFESELCWCIQQLEANLAIGKLREKQAQDINKRLKSLKSNSVPLIRKRQIMKNTLGDYRKRMMEDEQKFSKTVSSVKFIDSTSANKKSMFIRKAIRHDTEQSESQIDNDKTQDGLSNTKAIINSNRTQTPFQFNFQTC